MILHQFIDYETLRIIWWLLLGVLLIGFAVTDGFDLGTATLLPFVAKTDLERRVVINSIGPTWEGNQVWLILGGGAIFAAWPPLYAVSFSGFYLAMFAILFALILRPVGFKYRSKRDDATWRNVWDWALFVGGAVPSLIFGVAVGNVLQGVAFHFNNDLRIFYDGTTSIRAAQSLRTALRTAVGRYACHARFGVARIENGRCRGRSCARLRQHCRPGDRSALRTWWNFTMGRN